LNPVRVVRAKTATDLWRKTVRWHLASPSVDHISPIASNLNDVVLRCDGILDYDFDLAEIWLTGQRWTMLIRDYLDPQETADFIRRCRVLYNGRGSNGSLTEMAFRRNPRRAKRHKWGNCLIGVVYRGAADSHIVPTLTFYSRVSYNAYIMGLDLAIGHVLARQVAEGSGTEIAFQWNLNVLSLHPFKSIPYIYTQPDLSAELEQAASRFPDSVLATPTWAEILKWQSRIVGYEEAGKTLDEEKYGPLRRVRRRYQEWQRGEFLPSIKAEELTFEKLEGFEI